MADDDVIGALCERNNAGISEYIARSACHNSEARELCARTGTRPNPRLLNAKYREVTMENREKPGPLDGIRVLDLGHYIAIAILTRMSAVRQGGQKALGTGRARTSMRDRFLGVLARPRLRARSKVRAMHHRPPGRGVDSPA
jgi:hypothetical protein